MSWFVAFLVLIAISCYGYLVRRAIRARRRSEIRHFSDVHFKGITLDGMKFVYCPKGRIISWSAGDYDHEWCHYEEKFFNELKG